MHASPMLALCCGAILLCATSAGAQATVAGKVVAEESGEPLPAVRVVAPGLDRYASTRADGRFVLGSVPAGRHVLTVSQIGFAPRSLVIVVPERDAQGDTIHVEVAITRIAISLERVQVTATPTHRDPLAVAQSTSTLSGRALERSMGTSLGATLQSQPGMAMRYDGPGASAPIIRGLTGDRVLILQDGQRTGDVASTAPDHGVTIDPVSASRVEIVRGPASLLYGNNAIGGVVNVISDDIPLARPAQVGGSATATAESAAPGGGAQLELTGPLTERTAFRLRAGARSHDDARAARGYGASALPNTHASNRHAVLGVARIGERHAAGAAYRGYVFDYGIPVPLDAPEQAVTIEGARHEVLMHAETRRGRWTDGAHVEANAQWYRHDEFDVAGSIGTALELRSQHLRALARTRPLGPFRDGAFGVSASLRQNGVSGASALTPPNTGSGVGVFLFQELALRCVRRPRECAEDSNETSHDVRFPIGVRFDRYEIGSDATEKFGPAVVRSFSGVSGSVGLTVPLIEGSSIGATVARAFRSPTAEELFSKAGHTGTGAFEIGDASLGAETNTGIDLVLRVVRRSVSAQLSAYASRIDGYIALHPAGRDTLLPDGRSYPLYIVAQRDVRMRGAEGSIEGALTERLVIGVMGDVIHARDDVERPLPFMPPARVGASARWEDRIFSAGAAVRHSFAQGAVPAGEMRTNAHTLVDLHAGIRLIRSAQVHSITLRVDNAGDVLHQDGASRIKDFAPSPGRNVSIVYRLVF